MKDFIVYPNTSLWTPIGACAVTTASILFCLLSHGSNSTSVLNEFSNVLTPQVACRPEWAAAAHKPRQTAPRDEVCPCHWFSLLEPDASKDPHLNAKEKKLGNENGMRKGCGFAG